MNDQDLTAREQEVRVALAEFIKSVADINQAPVDNLPEVAFVGRSNTGKSTLINSLCQRKKLAVTSKTPGRTRLLNFFDVQFIRKPDLELRCRIVDLPGYGYAEVSKKEQGKWHYLIEQYLLGRQNLSVLFLLMDIRRDPQTEEQWFFSRARHDSVTLVLTKADKFSGSQAQERRKKICKQLDLPLDRAFVCSSLAGRLRGIDELRNYLVNYLTKSCFLDE